MESVLGGREGGRAAAGGIAVVEERDGWLCDVDGAAAAALDSDPSSPASTDARLLFPLASAPSAPRFGLGGGLGSCHTPTSGRPLNSACLFLISSLARFLACRGFTASPFHVFTANTACAPFPVCPTLLPLINRSGGVRKLLELAALAPLLLQPLVLLGAGLGCELV